MCHVTSDKRLCRERKLQALDEFKKRSNRLLIFLLRTFVDRIKASAEGDKTCLTGGYKSQGNLEN
ncbi:unnamed protein product [Fusarium graminearum]|nr:unnamed protein product [Fusarium graminearum]